MMEKRKVSRRMAGLILLFILCFFMSFFLGRYPISPKLLLDVILSKITGSTPYWSDSVEQVLFQVRFPRVIMGTLIGAGLSCAGAAYQGIFQKRFELVSISIESRLADAELPDHLIGRRRYTIIE